MFWPILCAAMFSAAPCKVHAFVMYLITDKTQIEHVLSKFVSDRYKLQLVIF